VLSPLGFTAVQIDSCLICIKKKQVGKAFYGKEWSIYVDRDRLDVVKGGETQETEITYVIDKNTSVITEPIQLELKQLLVDEYRGELNRKFEVIDRDQLVFPLQLRKWKAGDKMRPLGMQGKKKVSDILTDLKIARAQKDNTFVLLSEGKVVWLVGHRLDDRFKVTDTSKKLLQIKLQ
jgi:tRNA(Ile)-lysidine synthase